MTFVMKFMHNVLSLSHFLYMCPQTPDPSQSRACGGREDQSPAFIRVLLVRLRHKSLPVPWTFRMGWLPDGNPVLYGPSSLLDVNNILSIPWQLSKARVTTRRGQDLLPITQPSKALKVCFKRKLIQATQVEFQKRRLYSNRHENE